MGGSPDVDVPAPSAKIHAGQAELYDCEERYVMVKVRVDFQYVIEYTSPKFFDSWASKNCRLRIKKLLFIQRGTIFAVYIWGVGKSVICVRYVAAVKEFPVKHL